MMKNKSHIFLIVLVTFFISSMLVSAEPVTETVCDETFVLEYGYLWMITKRTPALNTSVTITIDSDKMVDFYISDVGETEKYVEGQDIYVYELEENVTNSQFNYILEKKQQYEFVVINFNIDMEDTNLHFVITFTYEPSGLNWFTWVGIGLGAFAVILLISRFRIRRKQKISISAQAGAYSTVNQHITISQDDSIQKTIQKSSPTKVCSYCGSDVETDAQFCTNCGAKF